MLHTKHRLVDISTTCRFMPCIAEDSPGVPVIWIGVSMFMPCNPSSIVIRIYYKSAHVRDTHTLLKGKSPGLTPHLFSIKTYVLAGSMSCIATWIILKCVWQYKHIGISGQV